MVFSNDQITLQKTKDYIQYAIHRLGQISKLHNHNASAKKKQVIAFKGKYLIRSKILINSELLEQILHINFLDCDINYKCSVRSVQERYQ